MDPSYLFLGKDEIKTRAEELYKRMTACDLCPKKCGVNRIAGELGACRVGTKPVVASYGAHFGEESFLVGGRGSGTIFFSFCNLSCVYCQNWEISQKGRGEEISSLQLARVMLELQRSGCQNINLVTPTHQIAAIVEAISIAVHMGLALPVVYNSSGYESVDTLKVLDKIIDIYMPDFKYGSDKMAEKYSKVKAYTRVAKSSLAEMYRQVGALKIDNGVACRGVFVRHLVLPNGISESKRVLQLISSVSKDIPINIMNQYHPAYKAHNFAQLNRRITVSEYHEVVHEAQNFGLTVVS